MNLYYVGSALNVSTLYMIAGTGAALSLKTGEYNLGGEGQIYLGGFLSAVILNQLCNLPGIIALPFSFLAAFIVSGLLTLLSAFLKQYKNADFLFTTYIASAAVIPFIDGLISGPFRSKTENLLATSFISQNFRLPVLLKPSSFNISVIPAIGLCIFFFYILYHTAFGRKLCIFGISNTFAKYAGYDRKKITYSSAFISGGLHGLCGAVAIAGTYYTCHLGFYSGMGWNAFSAALIAAANPILLIPSSLFMGFITTYSTKYSLYHNFGFDMSSIIQAVILFIISFPILKKGDTANDI